MILLYIAITPSLASSSSEIRKKLTTTLQSISNIHLGFLCFLSEVCLDYHNCHVGKAKVVSYPASIEGKFKVIKETNYHIQLMISLKL